MNNRQKTRFTNLTQAFWHIREYPLDYLPEKSLSLFSSYWDGYAMRYTIGLEDSKRVGLPSEFHQFMATKYGVTSSHGSFGIASVYSRNEAQAFDLWFECLDEFLAANDSKATDVLAESSVVNEEKVGFYQSLRNILKRPAMYVGTASFTLVASLFSGWFKAIEDFALAESKEEQTFREFQRYIELKDINLPGPPWNKIIWFWAQREESALEMFEKYVEEFCFQGKGYIENMEYHWQARKVGY